MKSKIDKIFEGEFDKAKLQQYGRDTMNFLFSTTIISGAIVAVQSPVKTVLLQLTKYGTFLPPASGGVLAAVRGLYAGTSAALSGSLLRTSYVTTVKGSAEAEEAVFKAEQSAATKGKAIYFTSAAVGEVLITNRSENRSQLAKINALPANYPARSLVTTYDLVRLGFASRVAKSLLNFSALCLLEEKISAQLQFKHAGVAHGAAGFVSGMVAAGITFPLDYYRDYALTNVSIAGNRLQAPSPISLLTQAWQALWKDPLAQSKGFGMKFVQQAPIRMGLTGVIFATVSGLSSALGKEPASDVIEYAKNKRVTLFGQSQTTAGSGPKADVAPQAPEKKA